MCFTDVCDVCAFDTYNKDHVLTYLLTYLFTYSLWMSSASLNPESNHAPRHTPGKTQISRFHTTNAHRQISAANFLSVIIMRHRIENAVGPCNSSTFDISARKLGCWLRAREKVWTWSLCPVVSISTTPSVPTHVCRSTHNRCELFLHKCTSYKFGENV